MMFFGLLLFITIIFVQPQLFIPSVKGMPLVAIVMGFVSVAWIFHIGTTKKDRFVKAHQNTLMIAFWASIVVSSLSVGWLTYTKTILSEGGKIIVIYFLVANIIDTESKLIKSLWVIVLSATFLAVTGIMQKYGIDITGVGIGREGRIRGVGIFDTNQLAYALAFVAPLVFGLFHLSQSVLKKLMLIAIFTILYYAIYLTESRGGILCSVAVIVLLFLIFSRSSFIKIFGTGIAGMLFLFFIKMSSRLQTVTTYSTDSSMRGRLNVWGEVLINLKDYPLLGIGKSQFGEYYSIAPHNSYIQVMAEVGLVGLFLWLGLFYYSIKNLKYIYKNVSQMETNKIILSKSMQIALYAYLIGSFLSGSAYYVTLYIFFALIVVLQKISNIDYFKKRQLLSLVDVIKIGSLETAIIILLYLVT